MNKGSWKKWADSLKSNTHALYLAGRDPRVPLVAKVIIGLVVAYALSPIDIIPDFIPVIGYLDDLLLVPLGVLLAVRMIPKSVWNECQARAAKEKGDPMNESNIKIRLMKADDFDAVVRIDEKVLKTSRPEYYEMKFEKLFSSKDYLPVSLVAEEEDGTVVGFVMGELYMGEYGLFQEEATLDTIGVDIDYQQKGIGEQLIDEFADHLKRVGVQRINTLVDWNDSKLIHFFSANKFSPSKTINLERKL
jgi:uncharacterized membrane protein YkvA (DUF1232 family)